jgi:hypothetical protein
MTRNPLSLVFHAAHGLNQTFPGENGKSADNTVPTRQAHVIDDQGAIVQIPAISANAIRGRLRRVIAGAVYDAVFGNNATGQRKNWHVAALMFAGGASMTDYVATPEALGILRTLLPVYAMGGQYFTTQIPGRVIAHDVLMVTAKTPPELFGLAEAQEFIATKAPGALRVGADPDAKGPLVRSVRFVKRADPTILLDDDDMPVDPRMELDSTAQEALAKVKKAPDTVRQANIFGYEVSPSNSWWAGGLDVLPDPAHPDMERWAKSLVRWAAEEEFGGSGTLGGKLSAGYGLVTGTVLVPEDWPDAKAWREWLDTYATAHSDYSLATLLAAGSPLASMARITEKSKRKKKADAKKAGADQTPASTPEVAEVSPEDEDEPDDEMEATDA